MVSIRSMPFSSLPLDLLADGLYSSFASGPPLKKVGCLPEATEEFQRAGIELRSQPWPASCAKGMQRAAGRRGGLFWGPELIKAGGDLDSQAVRMGEENCKRPAGEPRLQLRSSPTKPHTVTGRAQPKAIWVRYLLGLYRAPSSRREVLHSSVVWSCPALMDGLGLRWSCLGHHVSFRIRWATDSPGPSGDGTGCRSLR
jgi:hypothetical protein